VEEELIPAVMYVREAALGRGKPVLLLVNISADSGINP
jgi:hypothetical protein